LAEDAVDFLDNNVVPMVNVLNNDREKRRRLGAIKRVRNRLWSAPLSSNESVALPC
jgi:hypothetical protein